MMIITATGGKSFKYNWFSLYLICHIRTVSFVSDGIGFRHWRDFALPAALHTTFMHKTYVLLTLIFCFPPPPDQNFFLSLAFSYSFPLPYNPFRYPHPLYASLKLSLSFSYLCLPSFFISSTRLFLSLSSSLSSASLSPLSLALPLSLFSS